MFDKFKGGHYNYMIGDYNDKNHKRLTVEDCIGRRNCVEINAYFDGERASISKIGDNTIYLSYLDKNEVDTEGNIDYLKNETVEKIFNIIEQAFDYFNEYGFDPEFYERSFWLRYNEAKRMYDLISPDCIDGYEEFWTKRFNNLEKQREEEMKLFWV